MKSSDWKFWFAIIGALLTASGMFWNLKVDLTRTQVEVEHIKQDVAYIKNLMERRYAFEN
ncbi:MAG: hypothetical protein A3I05_08695 [Deltaproteobacteria bacterium RIFCSPLOWO2_02_FULL_44_10]|nr:MAG: hypothetical protein A3C46_02230 [Deltaproteobacteria bacterium RIFCSPHIGHO2_02_FULL_44_16]OGQ45774.1 MAG: hypothetical protein A3I05_08695 [Deltaproteobacteria bacterium RIFCSPLOWO2_02_FULL_44_10]